MESIVESIVESIEQTKQDDLSQLVSLVEQAHQSLAQQQARLSHYVPRIFPRV